VTDRPTVCPIVCFSRKSNSQFKFWYNFYSSCTEGQATGDNNYYAATTAFLQQNTEGQATGDNNYYAATTALCASRIITFNVQECRLTSKREQAAPASVLVSSNYCWTKIMRGSRVCMCVRECVEVPIAQYA
jgi:hypothetical protein